jgi:hypothetical protein
MLQPVSMCRISHAALASIACLLLSGSAALAQDLVPAGSAEAAAVQAPASPPVKVSHPFWDKENVVLFVGVAGSRALDFASTKHFRKLGDNEWLLTNQIVDNTPLFVTIEAAGAAASIGVAYLLHRANHHRIERWLSVLHIGITVGGAIHNYSLKAPPLVVTPARLAQR